MNSIYTTSLRTQPAEQNISAPNNNLQNSPNLSQSYKDLLFNHIINIQNLQDKQNTQTQKIQPQRRTKYSKIAEKMILSQISPNLGTLNDFISERQENRLIYTSKKKRHQQASEDNVIKKKILQKNTQEAILKSDSTSMYQKKIASKVFVQRIFNSVFNTPVEQFMTKNTIKQPKKSQMLNISTLESLLSSDYLTNNEHTNKLLSSRESNKTLNNLTEKRPHKDKAVHITFDPETKLKRIYELKSNYYNLKKLQIPKQNNDFALLIDAQNQLDKYLKQLSQGLNFAKRNSIVLNTARNSLINGNALMLAKPVNVEQRMLQVSQKFRCSKRKSVIFADTIAKVTDDQVVFKRMQFKDLQMGLYMINYVRLQKISVIRLENITIEQTLLFLFLDTLAKFAPQINPLKEISICSIAIENVTKFSEKISQVLRQINVKKLCLNYTDIGSKQFTKICVGLSENQCIQQVQLKNNRIDYLAIKPLQTMLRISHNIKTIDLRNNQISNYPNLKAKDERIIV